MKPEAVREVSAVPQWLFKTLYDFLAASTLPAVLIGPIAGLVVALLPLGVDPAAQKALAVVVFMIVYWIMEPVEHALTALIGCYLFWALGVAKFSQAFSGFVSSAPWFIFGALLMGEAASRTGLVKRFGYKIMHHVGTSYPRLLLGVILLSFLLNFLIPSSVARIAVMAPMLVGIIAASGCGKQSNLAKGLFIILTYTAGLFDKMMLSGAVAILTRGIIEEQTGAQILWSQWFFAYLPAIVVTIFVCWVIMQWLYPVEVTELAQSKQYLRDALTEIGPVSRDEKKVLAWVLLATTLWATDFVHHMSPAVIGLGVGLLLVFPTLGVLDAKAIQRVNFLVIIFSAGALSMGNVLVHTNALRLVSGSLVQWVEPLLSNAFYSAITLYWGGFLYHLCLGNGPSMVSSSLPLLLQVAEAQGGNPIALGLIWAFAASATLFVYQAGPLVLGYSYGYFDAKDLFKVALVLTVIEGLLLMVLVPLYWPLIGLHWAKT
jgi:anion transporter